jgi:hypothetical protein
MAYGLVYTLRPAYHMFADIAAAYVAQGLVTPDSVVDGWEKLMRVEKYAELELGCLQVSAHIERMLQDIVQRGNNFVE